MVPALISPISHPSHFSSLQSTISRPWPLPAQALSLTQAQTASTSSWVITSGSRGILRQSKSAHIFSLHKAFHGSLVPSPQRPQPRAAAILSHPTSHSTPGFSNGNVRADPSGMWFKCTVLISTPGWGLRLCISKLPGDAHAPGPWPTL